MLPLVFTSCQSNTEYANLTAKIDSTLADLENNRDKLDVINEAKATQMLVGFDSLNNMAMEQFTPSDTAKYWRNEIADLQFCSKSLSRYLSEEKQIQQKINFIIKQLTTLKEDLQNGLVPKDKVDEYYGVEMQSAEIILRKSSKRGGRALFCYNNYNSILAKADSVYNNQILAH